MRKSFFYVLFILLASFSCQNLDITGDAKEIVRSSHGMAETPTLQSLMFKDAHWNMRVRGFELNFNLVVKI